MKKTVLLTLMLVLPILLFTACGDDSNNSDKKNYGKMLVGTWKFTHGYSSSGGPYAAGWCQINGDVILKLNSDGTCTSMGNGSYNNGVVDVPVQINDYYRWKHGSTSASADYWFVLYFTYKGRETGDDYTIDFISENDIEIKRATIGSIRYRLKKLN